MQGRAIDIHILVKVFSLYPLELNETHKTTYGASIGGLIVKNKLFFFVNFEYEANLTAGPLAKARNSESEDWSLSTGMVHRPLKSDMDGILSYLKDKYN